MERNTKGFNFKIHVFGAQTEEQSERFRLLAQRGVKNAINAFAKPTFLTEPD